MGHQNKKSRRTSPATPVVMHVPKQHPKHRQLLAASRHLNAAMKLMTPIARDMLAAKQFSSAEDCTRDLSSLGSMVGSLRSIASGTKRLY